MIGKLDNKQCKNWVEHLATITHAYNTTHSQITGYSLSFLMMGCRPQLLVDLLFPTSRQLPKTKNVNEYVKVLHGHEMISMLQGSLLTKKQQGIKDSMTIEPESLNTTLETKCSPTQSVGEIGCIPWCPTKVD